MNMLDAILNANNGASVRQIGSQFGLPDDQTAAAIGALVPALAAGLQKNAASADGMGSLLSALAGGGHARYMDDPQALISPAAVEDGNGILGHVFGTKDVSREVAARASAQTGIGADVLKKMLPVVATLAMGALARQSTPVASGAAAPAGLNAGSLMNMLSATLDRNRSGSIVDEVMGVLGAFRK
jgi:hypothetical protein